MSHYHLWVPTLVVGLEVCSCGSTNPPSVPRATSEDAAAEISPKAATIRGRVYELIKQRGRVTDEEICRCLDLNPSTARPRRIELMKQGLVRDSGERDLTESKRRAVLWEIAS